MAAPVIPCDSCGTPIPDSDLETGTAITLLGKRYCVGCKTEAIQGVSLDELGGGRPAPRSGAAEAKPAAPPKAQAPRPAPKPAPSPAAKTPSAEQRPPAPKPAPRPAAPPPPEKPERKAAAPRRAAPAAAPTAKPSSRTLLLIGVGAAVVVIIVVAVVLTRPPTPGPSSGTSKAGPTTTVGPAATPQDREAHARDAFAKVEDLAGRTGTSPDHLLAAIDKARPICRATAWEKKLEELRVRAQQEKEAEEAARELSPLVDELRGAVATDPEFKRFGELQPKFQLALEMAGKTASAKMPEIRALQKEYNDKYEKLADPYFADINEAAIQLAEERRYDDALRKINTFPQHLRLSRSWLTLDKLRQDIERRKKDAAPKKK